MEQNVNFRRTRITGEVVQAINKDNRRFIKLSNASCYIELSPDTPIDAHLGDIIIIDGCIDIQSFEPSVHRNRLFTSLDEFPDEKNKDR